MKAKFPLISLFIIVLYGSLIRLEGIVTKSFAFTYDVGRDMLALHQIVYAHKIPLIGFTTGVEGIFYGPWWYYILTVPYAVSGGDPQYVAYFIALTGISTIVLLSYTGNKTGGAALGIVLALLTAISPAMIGFSNQIWNPNMAPVLIASSFVVILRLLDKPKWWLYLLLGIISGLLIEAEIVFGLLLLLAYLLAFLVIARKTILTKRFLFSFVGLFIIFSPRILFEFRHQFLMTKTIIRLLTHASPSSAGSVPIASKLVIFFNLFSDTLTGGSRILGLILLGILLVSAVVFWPKIKGLQRKLLTLCFIVIAVFMAGISFFRHDIWPHYLIGIPVFYILAAGILLTVLKNTLRKGVIVLGAFLICLIWMNVKPLELFASLNQPLYAGDDSVYRNQLAVLDFVYQKAHGQPFNEIVYTPPIYDYTYRYLFLWYGPKVYHYAPSTKKEKLFFVIIEPDTQHPTLLRDWLTLRKHDGKILSQQIVKGGVTVQVRVH